MSNTPVKCRVKGPKGLWIDSVCHPEGTVVELSPESYASKVARGNVYAKGEHESIVAAAKAKVKASQDEKAERAKPNPESKSGKAVEGKKSTSDKKPADNK